MLAEGYFSTVAIISADSRQVYRGLEIVSGADIPADFELAVSELPHFVKKTVYGEVQLHGVAMIEPSTEWSLADFQKCALAAVNETWRHGGLPIIVGGTGLYHARLFAQELASMPGPDERPTRLPGRTDGVFGGPCGYRVTGDGPDGWRIVDAPYPWPMSAPCL
jgi:tRNA A37 N6-isopentenylltransferase MiaA